MVVALVGIVVFFKQILVISVIKRNYMMVVMILWGQDDAIGGRNADNDNVDYNNDSNIYNTYHL